MPVCVCAGVPLVGDDPCAVLPEGTGSDSEIDCPFEIVLKLSLGVEGAEPVGAFVIVAFEMGNGGTDETVPLWERDADPPGMVLERLADEVSEAEGSVGPLDFGPVVGTDDLVLFVMVKPTDEGTVEEGEKEIVPEKVNSPVVSVT